MLASLFITKLSLFSIFLIVFAILLVVLVIGLDYHSYRLCVKHYKRPDRPKTYLGWKWEAVKDNLWNS